MAKTKRAGKAYKNAYSTYPSRYAENRRRRLKKHLANNPNDETAKAALDNADKYRRRKPKVKNGWIPQHWARDPEHPINQVGPGRKIKMAKDIAFSKKVANEVKYGQFKLPDGDKQTNYEFQAEHEASLVGE